MRALLGFLMSICSFIAHMLAVICKSLYQILKLLRIRILALYLVVCGIVQLIWGFFSTGDGILYFWLVFAVCLLITVFSWIYAFRKKSALRKEEKQRQEERRQQRKADNEKNKRDRQLQKDGRKKSKQSKKLLSDAPVNAEQTFPVYFEALGHPGYIFAEYEDRYELYHNENGTLVYLRTDKKQEDQHD